MPTTFGVETLICGAFWPEIRLLELARQKHLPKSSQCDPNFVTTQLETDALREIQQKNIPWNTIRCVPLGIGSLKAGMTLTKILLESPDIKNIFFMGTAGFYPENSDDQRTQIGDVLNVDDVVWGDSSLLKGEAYLPTPNASFISSLIGTSSSKKVRCVSTFGITSCPVLAHILGQLGLLENLELYGVAMSTTLAQKSWTSILGVTNEVGSKGHEQWKQNHIEVSAKMQRIGAEKLLKFV